MPRCLLTTSSWSRSHFASLQHQSFLLEQIIPRKTPSCSLHSGLQPRQKPVLILRQRQLQRQRRKTPPSEVKRMKQLRVAMYRQSNMKDVTQMLVLLDGLKLQNSSEYCGLLTGALMLQRSDAVFIEQRLIGQCVRRTLRNLGLTCEALAQVLENLLATLSDYVRPPKDPAKPDAIRHGLHLREWLDMYWIFTRPFKLCWQTLLALPRLLWYGIFQDVRLRLPGSGTLSN